MKKNFFVLGCAALILLACDLGTALAPAPTRRSGPSLEAEYKLVDTFENLLTVEKEVNRNVSGTLDSVLNGKISYSEASRRFTDYKNWYEGAKKKFSEASIGAPPEYENCVRLTIRYYSETAEFLEYMSMALSPSYASRSSEYLSLAETKLDQAKETQVKMADAWRVIIQKRKRELN